jgi:RNA polymerase sigma-70 factor (ECF subfamily)
MMGRPSVWPEDFGSAVVRDDDAALEELYTSELPGIFSFAAARVGRTDAEDVAAEVFHAAAVAFGDGRSEQVTKAWLFTVARNAIIGRWRRDTRRKAIVHLAFNGRVNDTAFPADWTEDPRREAVLEALNHLSPRHRTLLVLHHIDGMRVRELAEATGQSERAMESALARARRAFRTHYQQEEPWTT